MMEPFEGNSAPPPEPAAETGAAQSPSRAAAPSGASQDSFSPLSGDPLSYVASTPEPAFAESSRAVLLPADLRISWSWIHLAIFLFAGLAGLLVVPTIVALGIAAYTHQSQKQLQELTGNPAFLVATQVLWFAVVLFFLWTGCANSSCGGRSRCFGERWRIANGI